MARLQALFFGLCALNGALAQTWCGKDYTVGSPIIPPGGQFAIPATSTEPLLTFRCAPAIKPYLGEDALAPAAIIVDTLITYQQISGAASITLPSSSQLGELVVTVTANGKFLTTGVVPLNASKTELPFSLTGLQTQKAAYNVSCTAMYSPSLGAKQTFQATTALSYLPNPESGSVTKMDLRSGSLLARPANDPTGPYGTVFPLGFYTNWGGYLDTNYNFSFINDLAARGYTIVHPVPTYDNLTQLGLVVDRMAELGLYLMYDMRWDYQNATAVTEQVNMFKNRSNLLLWYTGDEPDGSGDPLNATSLAYDLIYELDGYHPVSLVLNCQDYYFEEYTSGADIVMQDTYPTGINATWSVEYHTECTPDYGCCGCDNCVGDFEDISERMDDFRVRLEALGWDRTKAVWAAPQAFGDAQFWNRVPSGKEFIVQSVLSINHGGLGIVPWNDPTTDDITNSATVLGKALPTLKSFILSPSAVYRQHTANRVDVGMWTVGTQTLVLATNLNYFNITLNLATLLLGSPQQVTEVYDSGATYANGQIQLESVGTGGFVIGL
ncbi:hypothetical protein NEOLEDRAFT_763316 [Neolentinus lepideus HHB14362 ss-1]|uniref:Glycoside hydrolase family 2 protein n=1 Tax=Neolentinus lepideus HHB14362 ss-1 TaxID=1314782 RepID=A0A165PPF8_9AGAM|nr:hypothetical protein NEOLEDRAFT_763316 [Neolentinus lepideus HHB14362 ss-1]